jgi:uridine kinase
MIGDKLVITDYHRAAARRVYDHLERLGAAGPMGVSVSGESGCGKSETAHCLKELLEAGGRRCVILAQDDYFHLPPRSNHEKRLEQFDWVGPGEVRLGLLDEHVALLKSGSRERLTKPLVYFEENRIGEEILPPGPYDVVIVEGTYTALLENLDARAFIDRNYRQTKKARLARARDPALDFLEKVLEREHGIISAHRSLADVVIDPPPEEVQAQSS